MARLDPQRTRVQDDLRGLVAGDVRCDDVSAHLYATDSGPYEVRPLGVVCPKSTADVAACVMYASEHGLPIHPRGAGTRTAGGAIGPGLVLDFSRHMRRAISVGEDSVRVQAGIARERLNAYLEGKQARRFRPSGGNPNTGTIGGLVAVNGLGRHALRDGRPSEHVRAVQVVLADGKIVEFRRDEIPRETPECIAGRAIEDSLANPIHSIVRQWKASGGPAPSPAPGCAYALEAATAGEGLDLRRLLAGAEGTLGVITELELATVTPPRQQAAVLLFFERVETALQAVEAIVAREPTACDLVDRRRLNLIRDDRKEFRGLAPGSAEAVLVVEFEDHDARRLHDRVDEVINEAREDRGAFGHRHAYGGAELNVFRNWLHDSTRSLARVRGPLRPMPLAEDIQVPTEALRELFATVHVVLKQHKLTGSIGGHVGVGQLEVVPLMAMDAPDTPKRMTDVADALHEAAVQLGGGFGAFGGCGLMRSNYIARWFPEFHTACRRIKTLLDPQGLLNVGKIVHAAPHSTAFRLRATYARGNGKATADEATAEQETPPERKALVELRVSWSAAGVAETARMCDGCGDCRERTAGVRMCPMFRLMPAEQATPRSKTNLLLGLLSGRVALENLASDELKEAADLCVHCHLCRTECPCQVDIAALAAQCKAAHVAAHGLSLGDRFLSRIDQVLALAAFVVWPVNWAVGDRRMRWLLEKVVGVAQGRKLPRMANFSYLSRLIGARLTKPSRRGGEKVCLFLDTYPNYFDTRLVDLAVSVLGHNGVQVFIPPRQRSSGTQAVVHGDLDRAARLARINTAILADAVRQGYRIVTIEPSSAACLRFEYPTLIDDDETRVVAENTTDLCGYLWDLHRRGGLQLDFRPLSLSVGYHEPCRMASLRQSGGGEELLKLVPGMTVRRIEAGCCGMAGTFGFQRRYYRASLRAGRILMRELRSTSLHVGATECSACKIQMEQGAPKPTLHPVKLLALAYGLAPDDGSLFRVPSNRLAVS